MGLKAKLYKSCRVCSKDYYAWSTMMQLNRFCSPSCAAKWSADKQRKKREKALRQDTAKRKEALKTRGDWVKETQQAFNEFIRERDFGKHCISCGSLPEQRFGGSMDCGHYRSVGSAPHMRFVTFNAFSQCKKCNRELSGNAVEMRKGVALRLGLERLERVEHDNQMRKYSIEQLKRLKSLFKRRARNYRKWREAV